MGSLISDSDKSELEKVINSMHDTFAREIYAYKEAKKVIVSSNKFHGLYSNVQGEQKVENVPQYQTFKARIYYADKQSEENDQAGYDYMKDAKRIEFDGRMFVVNSDVRPHGLFTPTYYTLYLKPVDFE